jgi:cyclohexanone monooxygenase
VDFTGKRVGIIGTGSSAVQAVPVIAEQAAHLTVFQRTANFVMPSRNRPLTAEERDRIKADYRGQRQRMRLASAGYTVPNPPQKGAMDATPEERREEYEARWAFGGFSIFYAFNDTLLNADSNEAASDFVRSKLREIVKDPAVADKLTPHIAIGCKRLCIDTGYWEAFNRPNVSLVDVSETAIERITPTGVRVGGHHHPLDALIFATGFDAMVGTLNRIAIHGRDGALLKDKWTAHGPKAYLGLGVAGFPNLFLITGPGSPGVLTSVITAIEHHVEFVAEALAYMRANGIATIEPAASAEDAWVERVGSVAQSSLRAACHSWFLSAPTPEGKRIFMPYAAKFPVYVQEVADIVARGYDGFSLT